MHFTTAESVTEGHPDKVADQISDGVVDAYLSEDVDARVACETLVTHDCVVVAGEITSTVRVSLLDVITETLKAIGYDDVRQGMDYRTVKILVAVQPQSPDCSREVTIAGIGDQSVVVGYATNETPELMPLASILAHKMASRLAQLRRDRILPYLRPDGKTQVTLRYEDGLAVEATAVVVSPQHEEGVALSKVKADVTELVIRPTIPPELLTSCTQYYVNETGKFSVGGPKGDTGLTGRKLAVDTYGGSIPHGGGAFSGKDPSKIDRTGAYMARRVAKSVVANNLARRCMVVLTYVKGCSKPMAIDVETFGTASVDDLDIVDLVQDNYSFELYDMISKLDLKRPIFRKTATYGHFGRALPEFTWELVDALH